MQSKESIFYTLSYRATAKNVYKTAQSAKKFANFVATYYAESVSLFSQSNLTVQEGKRMGGHFLASYRLVWRGTVACFIAEVLSEPDC